jgi:hypothetical protein
MPDEVIICRVYSQGSNSLVMTVDRKIRAFMGLVPREILGFRCRVIRGRRIIIGEKLPLHAIANLNADVSELLPEEKD